MTSASPGSRPRENIKRQNCGQDEVVASEFQAFAPVALREHQQPMQFMPFRRLGRRNALGRDIQAPVVVLELQDRHACGDGKSAIAHLRIGQGMKSLHDLPGEMARADAQRAGDVAMKARGRKCSGCFDCTGTVGQIIFHWERF
jgi:hypothetical protein